MNEITPINTVKDLIDLWPSRQVLADEIATSKARVDKWPANGIPAWFHARVLKAGRARGFAITADDLVRLHDKPSEAA